MFAMKALKYVKSNERVPCNYCHQPHRRVYMSKHVRICKARNGDDSIESTTLTRTPSRVKKTTYKCRYCDKIMHDKGNYGRHEEICSRYSEYISKDDQCLVCGRCFKGQNKNNFWYHIKKHAQKGQVDSQTGGSINDEFSDCKHCGKKYQKAHNRKYHESICAASKIVSKNTSAKMNRPPVVIRFAKRNCDRA